MVDLARKVIAVLIALRGLTNFGKPFQPASGFVIFGRLLFPIVEGVPPQFAAWMYVVFAVPGIVVPWVAVWLLGRGTR